MKNTSKKSVTLSKTRGASMVEYALLLVAVLLLAAGSFKTLGKKLNTSVKSTYSVLQ